MTSPNRTALVTGANRGIGRAITKGLAARGGIHVLAAVRTAEDARKTAAAIGANVTGIALDLSDPLQAETRALAIQHEFGPIDILVNNAGILHSKVGLATPTEDMVASLNVNTIAPFALIRVFGAGMKKRGWGRIVNLSSGWGAFAEGMDGAPADYAVSKAALNALTFVLAQTFGKKVKINAACPGWVRTDMGGENATSSPEEGADTPIWLATLPDNGPTGGFFRDRQRIPW